MSLNLEYYQKINGTYGMNSKKEYYVHSTKQSISDEFSDNIAYENVKINDIDREVLIMDRGNSYEKTNDMKIISKPDEILNVGDIVEWKSEKWLITAIVEDGHVYYTKGYMTKTNNTLKFYDKNGILNTIPCIVNNSLSYIGTEETRFNTLNDDEIIITISNDEINSNITPDQIYLIGKRNYRVLSIQDIITNGLLYVKMKVSENKQVLPNETESQNNNTSIL